MSAVRIGQTWRSRDPRDGGRIVRVLVVGMGGVAVERMFPPPAGRVTTIREDRLIKHFELEYDPRGGAR